MEFNEFVKTVQDQAQLDKEGARKAVQATLQTLGERMTPQESRDLATQLPPELKRWLQEQGTTQKYDLNAFLQAIADREGCSFEEAQIHAQAVFQTLCQAVTHGEMKDVMSQLPKEFQQAFSCQMKTRH